MERTEKLFWQIYNCNTEQEIKEIITKDFLLSDNSNWIPYGNDKGNFGTFENQQNNAIPALVEKLTNAIDAILLKECKVHGIDPKSEQAPQTMAEAVEKFFNIKNADFSEVGDKGRRKIAEGIQVIATGERKNPSITIYDEGEGQEPKDFFDTFLSLHKRNKTDIPFVQGKYNMGSTGAVRFCGDNKYQLIASRKHIEIAGEENNPFGFTLVRKHIIGKNEKVAYPWFEVFAPNNEISSFNIVELDLGLWNRKFKCGSLVKLFSYELPAGSRSNIALELWRDLNQYLYHPALPLIVYENRKDFGGKSATKLMLGNKTRIEIDDREKKEKFLPFSIEESELGKINIEVSVFKHDVDKGEFIKNKAVVFTRNGQVQGFRERGFISQDLGFSLLRDTMLIHVDCTQINPNYASDVFMANRTHLNSGKRTEYLIDRIVETLKESDTLKQLNQSRKDILFRESKDDEELLKNLMANIPVDKELLNLLNTNGTLNFLKKFGNRNGATSKAENNNSERDKKKSNRFPSIFKIDLAEDKNGKRLKTIPINGKGVIKFETDVEDEYLFRPREKGEFKIEILQHKRGGIGPSPPPPPHPPNDPKELIDVTTAGPTDCTIKVSVKPKKIDVGDEIEIKCILTAPGNDLECIFWVKITDPTKEESKKKEDKKTDYPSLPTPIKVFKEKNSESDKCWNDIPNWGGDDIVKLYRNEKIIEAIAINMDSFTLERFLSKNKIKSIEQIKKMKDIYFTAIYLHSLFLYGILDKISIEDELLKDKIEIENFLPDLLKSYSTFLLYNSLNFEKTQIEALEE